MLRIGSMLRVGAGADRTKPSLPTLLILSQKRAFVHQVEFENAQLTVAKAFFLPFQGLF